MRKKLNTQFNTRQYMVSRDFEIYYYKDQHMKKVANHIHDYYEIYFFLEGDVSLEIEKKEYPLQYGDVAVVPPGLEHHAVIHDESVPYALQIVDEEGKRYIDSDEFSVYIGTSQPDRRSERLLKRKPLELRFNIE